MSVCLIVCVCVRVRDHGFVCVCQYLEAMAEE